MDAVYRYLNNQVIGCSPLRDKLDRNLREAGEIIRELEQSFHDRVAQYQADKKIMNEINSRMDGIRDNQQRKVEELQREALRIIEEELAGYEKKVIQALNPEKIKSNFTDKNACMDWLKTKVDICEQNLNSRLEEKTNQLFRGCFREWKDIYEDALQCMESRKLVIKTEDSFYGTLAVSKAEVGKRLEESSRSNCQFYEKLSEASEEIQGGGD